MSSSALVLLDLLADPDKVVWKASNGRWYVSAKTGQVKASAVGELLAAGRIVPCGNVDCYRRAG